MAIKNFIKGAFGALKARLQSRDDGPLEFNPPADLDTQGLVEWGTQQAFQLVLFGGAPLCDLIFDIMTMLKSIALIDKKAVPILLVSACNIFHGQINDALGFEFDCDYLQGELETRGNTGKSLSNVLTIMDTRGADAHAMVYYLFGMTQCGKPETPYIDADKLGWYGPKPENPVMPVSEGKTFNALHISDFHLDIKYQLGTESDCDYYMCCTDLAKNTSAFAVGYTDVILPAQVLGSYHCDTPESLMGNSLQNVADMHKQKNFEMGIFTGDMVAHDPDLYYSKATVEENEKQAYADMKRYLGDMPIYPTFGNHETYPNSQFAQDSSGFGGEFQWNIDLVTDLWKDYGWIDQHMADEAKHTAGSFAVTTARGLRIVSLDSNFWYKMNLYNYWNISDPDPSGLFRWFVDELNEAEKNNQRVWVVTHVPTGGTGDGLPWSSEIMRQIIVRFSPHVIAAVFYGHTHADQFTVYYDTPHGSTEMTNPVTMGWIVQSITPADFYNPSWRYYEVDTKTFEIMDSKNYYTDLSATFEYDLKQPVMVNESSAYPHVGYMAQTPKDANWEFLYSAREAYDPHKEWPADAPLNATFWDKVIKNLADDQQQLELFYDNWWRKSPFTKVCPNGGNCTLDLTCDLTGGSWDSIYNCKNGIVVEPKEPFSIPPLSSSSSSEPASSSSTSSSSSSSSSTSSSSTSTSSSSTSTTSSSTSTSSSSSTSTSSSAPLATPSSSSAEVSGSGVTSSSTSTSSSSTSSSSSSSTPATTSTSSSTSSSKPAPKPATTSSTSSVTSSSTSSSTPAATPSSSTETTSSSTSTSSSSTSSSSAASGSGTATALGTVTPVSSSAETAETTSTTLSSDEAKSAPAASSTESSTETASASSTETASGVASASSVEASSTETASAATSSDATVASGSSDASSGTTSVTASASGSSNATVADASSASAGSTSVPAASSASGNATIVGSASAVSSDTSASASAPAPVTEIVSAHSTTTVTATYCPVCEAGHKWQHPTGSSIPGVATVTVTSATKTVTVTCETDGTSTILHGTEKTEEPGVAVVTVTKGHEDVTKTVTVSCLSSGTSTWYEPKVTETGVAVVTVTPGKTEEAAKTASPKADTPAQTASPEADTPKADTPKASSPADKPKADSDKPKATEGSTKPSNQPENSPKAPEDSKTPGSSPKAPEAQPSVSGAPAKPASPESSNGATAGETPSGSPKAPKAPKQSPGSPKPAQANAGSAIKPTMMVVALSCAALLL